MYFVVLSLSSSMQDLQSSLQSAACGMQMLSCSLQTLSLNIWDPAPWPGIESGPPAPGG